MSFKDFGRASETAAAFEYRVLRLYDAMLDQAPAARDAWLRETCAGDPRMIEAVRAMVTADLARGMLPTMPPERRAIEDAPPPSHVGRYHVLREIGRGGMGVVYLAQRNDGLFDHRVAIKLIRSTVFSDRALAQFDIERRVLARLRHPHIAQMLDGGATDEGASYIIMELIAGTPITDYCAAGQLPVADRLTLFRQAAAAIEHAHRNLIVHADIKPSNVVVEDGFGVKLLDFGIARLLERADEHGSGAYTPGYASPARIAGLPPTPSDDIFAAGRLLHDLIRDDAGADSDLAAIADKAAADDPADRYGDIGELVEELGRWQAYRPVDAAPPTRRRWGRLFWRRHRLAIMLIGSAAALLLAAVAGITAAWLRAERERGSAERRYAVARELSRYLIGDVATQIAPLPGSAPVRERIARHAEQALEHLGGLAGDERRMGIDDALASVEVSEILSTDGREGLNASPAITALRRAETGLPALIADHPDRSDLIVMLARALVADARLKIRVYDELDAAERLLARADATLGRLGSSGSRSAVALAVAWDIANARATARDQRGTGLERTLRTMPAVLARFGRRARPDVAPEALRLEQSLAMLGNAHWYTGGRREALGLYRRAVIALSSPSLDNDARVVSRRAFEDYQVASSLEELDEKAEALRYIERAVDEATRVLSFDDTPAARHNANIMRSEYGVELAGVGRYDAAIAQGRASVAAAEALARLEPDSYSGSRAVPVDLRPLATIYLKAGRPDQACAAANRAIASWARIARRWKMYAYDGKIEQAELKRIVARCATGGARPR